MSVILVVDDVALERVSSRSCLEKNGHTVLEAENGAQALEMAKQHKPDAILMDIVMPEMDGFSAAKRLMMDPATRSIPLIMVSSKSQLSDQHRATQLGAKDYLIKPAAEQALLAALNKIL